MHTAECIHIYRKQQKKKKKTKAKKKTPTSRILVSTCRLDGPFERGLSVSRERFVEGHQGGEAVRHCVRGRRRRVGHIVVAGDEQG